MKLEADAKIAFPRDRVWKAYLDEIESLVLHLPNVSAIDLKSREIVGEAVKVVRLWTGKAMIPEVAKAFLKPHMLQWTDYATWDVKTHRCEWRIVTGALPKAISCSGVTSYEEVAPYGTLVSIRGDLTVHAAEVPGVPRFLAGAVQPLVERVIVAAIAPNLKGVAGGVEKYLEAQKARTG